jgi:pilus assembly protein CpaC
MRYPSVHAVRVLTLIALLPVVSVIALAQAPPEELRITVGKSIVIDYPTDIGRISTSNPEIVDAVAVSTREILLHAKSHGISTVVVWAKTGQRTFYNISVEHNLEPIRTLLRETFPDESIQVQAARDSVSLVGRVTSQAVSDRAAALVASLAKTVVNNLQVEAGAVEKQVMLRVKFAELNRNTSQEFGSNLMSTGALNTPGLVSTGQFAPPRADSVGGSIPGGIPGTSTRFTLSDALNVFAFRPDLNLAATIRALQSQGVLQILAEPNLVTTNGKEASFLVGGEFPVPVLQGGSNAGAVTIQFREFGIRLTFTPALTAHNTLRMAVRPEVSTIDLANAVTFSGFRIPALATRRMETNIELGPGQSFVIGGLIDDRVTDTMNRIPGLSNIPLLGALFKSRSENKSKTELVVMVTPEIVAPLNATDPKPGPVWPYEFLGPVVKPTAGSGTPGRNPSRRARRAKSTDGDQEPVQAAATRQPETPQEFVVRLAAPELEPPEPQPAAPAPAPAPQAVPEQAASSVDPPAADAAGPVADTAAQGAPEATGEPRQTNGKPQQANAEPQPTNAEPQPTNAEPQHTDGEPQPTNAEPPATKDEPQHTDAEPPTDDQPAAGARQDPPAPPAPAPAQPTEPGA